MNDGQHVPTMLQMYKDRLREKYDDYNLYMLVAMMYKAQAEKENLEEYLSKAQAEFDLLRLELIPAKMEADGIEGIRYEDIGRVSLAADMYAQILDKVALCDWLRDNNLEDLIQPNVSSSALKAVIKARIKKGEDTPPEDVVKITPFVRASITRR